MCDHRTRLERSRARRFNHAPAGYRQAGNKSDFGALEALTRGRFFLIAAQLAATVLFMINFQNGVSSHWSAWFVPMVLIVLVVCNSFWFTRAVAWVIFSMAFFSFLAILSAFTLRWRLESGFNPHPFYRAIFMYVAFIYVSLGQIKILGGKA